MCLVPEDVSNGRNAYHVMTELTKFVVFAGMCLPSFDMVYHRWMNYKSRHPPPPSKVTFYYREFSSVWGTLERR
jgi:hypothetical protein